MWNFRHRNLRKVEKELTSAQTSQKNVQHSQFHGPLQLQDPWQRSMKIELWKRKENRGIDRAKYSLMTLFKFRGNWTRSAALPIAMPQIVLQSIGSIPVICGYSAGVGLLATIQKFHILFQTKPGAVFNNIISKERKRNTYKAHGMGLYGSQKRKTAWFHVDNAFYTHD